jgi:purine-binding chemotaxis protein CheW
MAKPLFANEKVMKHYLDALLQDDSTPELSSSPVENLLSDVETKAAQHQETSEYTPGKKAVETLEKKTVEALDKKPVETPAINAQEPKDVEAESLVTEHKPLPATVLPQFDSFNDQFQALYFEVAGLTLAVPLNSLGGIYQLGEINRLIGKPDWFSGVMLHREEKLNVVDTARWVMPERSPLRSEFNALVSPPTLISPRLLLSCHPCGKALVSRTEWLSPLAITTANGPVANSTALMTRWRDAAVPAPV